MTNTEAIEILLKEVDGIPSDVWDDNAEKFKEAVSIAVKALSKKRAASAFIPPTLEEIQDYINENNLNIDAAYFYDHYEGNGWYVGSRKMKDWKATLRNWNRRDMNRPAPYAPQNTTANPFDF